MSENDSQEGLEVRSYFVRKRNALLTRADFGDLYIDYYLHLAEHGLKHAQEEDGILKESIAALTLHCASRPWNEVSAWTINFQSPLINVFVSGNNKTSSIIGHVFDEDIKEGKENLFYADMLVGDKPPRRSVTAFKGRHAFHAVEQHYHQSEQRPARYFQYDEEDFVMVSAQPDCDMDWFMALENEDILEIDKQEELSLLETRRYQWHCGCSQERIMKMLAPSMRSDPDSLFGEDASIRTSCPRCGARYNITKEALEAFLKEDV